MLSDGNAIRSVLTQENGVLEAVCDGKIIVDMSTIAPRESQEFAKMVAQKGGKYVDAPVSGSVGAAVAKLLLVLAGGDKEIVEACRPYFLTLGKDMIYFGETHQIELPLAKQADKIYEQAKANGKGKLDMAAIYKEIQEINQ